jgi:hypothetical protein
MTTKADSTPMRVHVCSFSEGLDDLKRRQQRDVDFVLRFLEKRNRFSVFEATANDDIAETMTQIEHQKLIRRTGGAYPWIEYKLTRKAKSRLKELAHNNT